MRRYTQTSIMSAAVAERLKSKGIEFSLREDCAAAMLRIATDKSINGTYPESPTDVKGVWTRLKYAILGRSLAIVPRSHIPRGFIDSNMDDEEDGSYFDRLQKGALAASVRSVVSKSALWMASIIDVFTGPSESTVNLASNFGIRRLLFLSSVHLSNIGSLQVLRFSTAEWRSVRLPKWMLCSGFRVDLTGQCSMLNLSEHKIVSAK
jgi:hypothetical protein